MKTVLFQICRAEKKDIPAISEFQTAMASETENKILNRLTVSSGVGQLLDNPQYGFYIVAKTPTETIACLMITYEWSDWNDGLFWWIQSVYVKPNWRKQGVFKAMFAHIRQLAASDTNCRGLRLYVEKNNLPARKTYENLNMKPTDYCVYETKP